MTQAAQRPGSQHRLSQNSQQHKQYTGKAETSGHQHSEETIEDCYRLNLQARGVNFPHVTRAKTTESDSDEEASMIPSRHIEFIQGCMHSKNTADSRCKTSDVPP